MGSVWCLSWVPSSKRDESPRNKEPGANGRGGRDILFLDLALIVIPNLIDEIRNDIGRLLWMRNGRR